MEVRTRTPEETFAFGVEFGQQLRQGAVVCLSGELGAGKTTLIKGIVSGAVGVDPSRVNSPTYVYLNIYRGSRLLYHFDLYRLSGVEEFLSMGFEEYLDSSAICCIEWAERIAPILPKEAISISLSHLGESSRSILVENQT